MFCEQCGSQIPETSKFCNGCGAGVIPLSPTTATPPATTSAPSNAGQAVQMAPEPARTLPRVEASIPIEVPSASANPSSAEKSHTVAVIVGAIVLVGIIVGGIAFFTQQNNSSTSSSSTSPVRPVASIPVPVTRTFDLNLSQGSFVVAAHRYLYFRFMVPEHSSNVHIDGNFDTTGGSGNDIEAVVLNAEQFAEWSNNQETKAYYVSGRKTSDTLNVKLPAATDAPVTYYLVFNNVFSVFSNKTVTSDIKLHYDRTL